MPLSVPLSSGVASSAKAPVGRQTLLKTLSHFSAMIFWWEVSTYRLRQLKCWKHFWPTASVLIKLWRNTFPPRSADVDTADVDEPS